MMQTLIPDGCRYRSQRRRAAALAVGMLVLWLGGCSGASPTAADDDPAEAVARSNEPTRRPHVIVILVDTLRADRLGAYGYQRGLSPVMDRWARQGVLFENAIAPAPWTLPAVASLFTGVYPEVHGANSSKYLPEGQPGGPVGILGIPEALPTFPEILDALGYYGLAVSANPFIRSGYGFERGFDHFMQQTGSAVRRGAHLNSKLKRLFELDAPDAAPRLIYLQYMDVHEPYWAEDEVLRPLLREVSVLAERTELARPERGIFRKGMTHFRDQPEHAALRGYLEYWIARYDAGVAQMDLYLAELEALLKEQGLWQNSCLILTSDHGEALGERDKWSHGRGTYQNELAIPLIVRWPGVLPAGRRVATPVSLLDVFPTLLDLMGEPLPARIQGRSRVAAIRSADEQPATPVFAAGVKRRPNEFAVVLDRLKLRVDPDDEIVELFDFVGDPAELNNLASRRPQVVTMLSEVLQAHRVENLTLSERLEKAGKQLSDDEIAELRALGYLGGDDDDE
jgi:arylsulfatase A-like enzyme